MVQTDRVETMLDGTVRVIEGKGYEPDGRLSFNVLRVISYDPDSETYSMRSYQSGRVRDHVLTPTGSGFAWEVGSSRQAVVRYEISVKNGAWTETATRMPEEGEPETYVEVKARRLRGGGWSEAGALAAR
jgi:hypothetical protein